MKPGPGADVFQPQWLAVALRALLSGRTRAKPATVGLETAGTTVAVRLDRAGPHITLNPSTTPRTVLQAEPHVVLGLAAGALDVDQAIGLGTLHGDRQQLRDVFAVGSLNDSPHATG